MMQPNDPLEVLAATGILKKEPAVPDEINGLIRSATARLADAQKTSNSDESRFDLAYNAAHALSLAALRWHGYRSENRYLVFQTLSQTLKLPNEQWRVLDTAHRNRNFVEYEGVADVDEEMVAAIIRVARQVAA